MGFGVIGIHNYFNSLGRTYHGIPNSIDRLKYMLREQYLHTAPANIAARPPVKKGKIATVPKD